MQNYLPFLPPGLALFLIVRRGLRPQRIKPNRIWTFPALITILALMTIGRGHAPDALSIAIYAGAALAGAVLGWFTTQHVELTLDDATGTIMSQPTPLGTALTAGVFLARFLLDYATGAQNGHALTNFAVAHGASLAWITNGGLLFVAARGLTRAWHMWNRTEAMIAQHKAAKAGAGHGE
jgi:hypothetical protein